MPISEYYGGRGREVMRRMKARYGEKAGERVFYATSNKQRTRKGARRSRRSRRG